MIVSDICLLNNTFCNETQSNTNMRQNFIELGPISWNKCSHPMKIRLFMWNKRMYAFSLAFFCKYVEIYARTTLKKQQEPFATAHIVYMWENRINVNQKNDKYWSFQLFFILWRQSKRECIFMYLCTLSAHVCSVKL